MPRPKPTPTERFQVSCEVEAAQLGSVVAHFTKMGLPNIHFELITDIKTFRQNRRDENITSLVAPNQTAEQILMPWLKDHPTFKAIEAAHHLDANGSSRSAAYPALKVLVEKKILKALGGGNYTRTDVKQLAAPKKKRAAKKAAKKAAAKPAKAKRAFDVPHGETILRLARRNHGRTTFENIKKHFESDGRNVASIHPTIKDLVGKKLLKRNGNASYEVITPTIEAKTENVEATHAA